jgi:DNA-directed RNA polymerase subunit K/omega
LVRFDHNRYSVAVRAARRTAQMRVYAERVVVWCDGEIVGEHARRFGRGQTAYDPWHYLPVLARKPGALRNGDPFRNWDLPPALAQIRRRLAGHDDGDRQFVDILTAVAEAGLDAVEAACAEAAYAEALSAKRFGGDVVLNILARQRDTAPPRPVATSAALTLAIEPAADCTGDDRVAPPAATPGSLLWSGMTAWSYWASSSPT